MYNTAIVENPQAGDVKAMAKETRILIVEDEPDMAEVISEGLESMGYKIVGVATKGEEAVEKTKELQPDVILMDIVLAGKIDGLETAARIKEYLDLPIIYITGHADEKTLQRAKITDPFGYIVKPFKIRELYISVEMALSKFAMERKIKESEQWLNTTLKSMGEGVIATDANSIIKFLNPVAETLTGWRKFEALGKPVEDIFVVKSERNNGYFSLDKLARESAKFGEVRLNSSYLYPKRAKKIPIEISYSPIREKNGQITGSVIVFQDISKRKKAEEKLKAAHDELERRVIERTQELAKINKELRNEIKIRKQTEEKLKASLQEKELLIKEIHHRVKNNMQVISSLLSLQEGYISDPKAIEMLQDSQNRVRTMALIHEKLYHSHDLTQIDFAEYMENFTYQLLSAFKDYAQNINIQFDMDKISLGIDTAIPCGLIVNELLTNAIKYAFPDKREGEITLSFKVKDDVYTLSIKDNGVGLPEDIDIEEPETFGLQLLKTLVEQLEGTMKVERQGGTTVTIVFSELRYPRRI